METWLHHVFGHFPIVLISLAAAAALLGAVRKNDQLLRNAGAFLLLAVLATLAAVAAGWLSAPHLVEHGTPADVVDTHRWLGVATLASTVLVSGAWYRWRRTGGSETDPLRWGVALGASVTALLVVAAGHTGGTMTHPGIGPFSDAHSHGASVADDHHSGDDHGGNDHHGGGDDHGGDGHGEHAH